MPYYLISFSNTHTAIATQKFFTGKIEFCIMPTLREISHSCGISIRVNESVLLCKSTAKEYSFPLFQLMKEASIPTNMYQIFYVTETSITPISP